MLKIFTLICIVTLTSLMAQTGFSSFETTLKKVSKNHLYIKDSPNFSIGSSGVVLHSFDQEHKTIVSTVEVIEKKDGQAVLKYKNFKGLKQSALPSYNIKPKEGDTVILNYLYQRAMAITPDAETLRFITTKFDTFEWVHPDNFASELYIEYTPIPTKEDFNKECTDNSFALLFFAINDKGYFVDCNSFKTLKQIDLPQSSKKAPMVPFYSRLKEIKGRMFGFIGGDGINDYNRYYKKLIGIK